MSARLTGKELRTDVKVTGVGATFTIGAVLPAGASVKSVSLDGHEAQYKLVTTTRGVEVQVAARGSSSALTITLS